MADKQEPTFWEKMEMVESGQMTVRDAARDPNPGLAFTTFPVVPALDNPGRTKKMPKKGKKQAAANGTAVESDEEADTTGTAARPKRNRQGFGGVLWQDDEMDFGLEKIVEWPEVTMPALTELINAEFVNRPWVEGNQIIQRGRRTHPAVANQYKGIKVPLLARLDEQTDKNAPSLGWR